MTAKRREVGLVASPSNSSRISDLFSTPAPPFQKEPRLILASR
jgi:hypothetical protein